MSDKQELLEQFQEITGIDDIAACLFYLDSSNWNIDDAVINGLSHANEPPTASPERTPTETRSESKNRSVNSNNSTKNAGASGSSEMDHDFKPNKNPFAALKNATEADDYQNRYNSKKKRLLHFEIEHDVEGKTESTEVFIPDTSTISEIKSQLSSNLNNVPVERMRLEGFRSSQITDETVLATLHLPVYNRLTLFVTRSNNVKKSAATKKPSASHDEDATATNLSRKVRVEVFESKSSHVHVLNLAGSKTIREFKTEVYLLTGIPSKCQKYSGWPDGTDDHSVLGLMQLDAPTHRVQLERVERNETPSAGSSGAECIDISSGDESDSEDLHKDLRNASSPLDVLNRPDYSSHTNRVPLIPADCDSIAEASENFVRVFEARYGDKHPFFNPVSLENALTELQTANFRVRKPLLLYLHDDNSVSSQIFCTQVLCSPTIIDFINSNFTLWAWDLTFAENRTKLIEWVETCLGHQTSLPVRVLTHDDFPALVVLTKSRQGVELVSIVKGTVILEDVMVQLMHALDICQAQTRFEEADSIERQHRQRVVSEQEQAYEASLAADKLKAEEKHREQKRKEAELIAVAEKEREKESERRKIERELRPEPAENCGQPITVVRMRLPGGETIERRFLLTDPLSRLFDFAASKGFGLGEHKFLTNFPKRDLSSMDPKKTLKDLNFSPREAIVIEQK